MLPRVALPYSPTLQVLSQSADVRAKLLIRFACNRAGVVLQ